MTIPRELRKTRDLIRGYHAPHEVEAPIVRVSDLVVRYEKTTALNSVSFELHMGDRVAVVGPNGAGKSTLFKVIAGVLPYDEGTVEVFGHRPGGHICIAYLPQRTQVDWKFPVTVADVVMMGRIGKIGFFRWPRAEDWDYVRYCLAEVGMTDLADRQISELSGGQQQRMFIARALAQEAELMLMDEPIGGVDARAQEDIFRMLAMLTAKGVTLLVSMHNLDLAATHFDRIMLLNRRLIGMGSPGAVLTAESLQAAYGGHLRLVDTGEGMAVLSDTCCDDEVDGGGGYSG